MAESVCGPLVAGGTLERLQEPRPLGLDRFSADRCSIDELYQRRVRSESLPAGGTEEAEDERPRHACGHRWGLEGRDAAAVAAARSIRRAAIDAGDNDHASASSDRPVPAPAPGRRRILKRADHLVVEALTEGRAPVVPVSANQRPANRRRDLNAPGQSHIEHRHNDIVRKGAGRYMESERLRCQRVRVGRDGSDVGRRQSGLRSNGEPDAEQSSNVDHQAEPPGERVVLAVAAANNSLRIACRE